MRGLVTSVSRRRRALTNGERRGATMVLVAILLVPLLGLAAFAMDLSYWQMGASQLQTAADAAALAGARALQYNATNDPQGVVTAEVSAMMPRNSAFGSTLNADSAIVEPMFYTPPSGTTAASLVSASWNVANAVQVTAQRTGGTILSGVVNHTDQLVQRRGTAWIANINSGSCVKPWSLPYRALYDRVAAITGDPATPSTATPRPDLTQLQLAKILDYTDAQRIIIFRPPTYDGAGGRPDSTAALGNLTYNDGMFSAFNFLSPTGQNNASGTTYQANHYGCSMSLVSVGTANTSTLPGANDIPCLGVNAMMGSNSNQCEPNNGTWTPLTQWPVANNNPQVNQAVTCRYATPTRTPTDTIWDARCYASTTAVAAGTPGVMQNVAWGDNVGNGSNQTSFRVIGKIKVLCVFRGTSSAYGVQKGYTMPARHSEVCSTGAGNPPKDYPQGTIVGVIQGPSSPDLGPGTVLGNIKGDAQRLILVQ